jgi:hypothetical protein
MICYGLDRSGLGWGLVEGSFEDGNKPSGSIKRWEVLEWLHNWQLFKKGSVTGVSECVSDAISSILLLPFLHQKKFPLFLLLNFYFNNSRHFI